MVAATDPPSPPDPPAPSPPWAPAAAIVNALTPKGTVKVCDAPVYANVCVPCTYAIVTATVLPPGKSVSVSVHVPAAGDGAPLAVNPVPLGGVGAPTGAPPPARAVCAGWFCAC